jgi:hypothetical protein
MGQLGAVRELCGPGGSMTSSGVRQASPCTPMPLPAVPIWAWQWGCVRRPGRSSLDEPSRSSHRGSTGLARTPRSAHSALRSAPSARPPAPATPRSPTATRRSTRSDPHATRPASACVAVPDRHRAGDDEESTDHEHFVTPTPHGSFRASLWIFDGRAQQCKAT